MTNVSGGAYSIRAPVERFGLAPANHKHGVFSA